ncbi:MAG TPA: phospho-N-acetylmuramoyl-pentapeptide-transferase [Candidatus Merdimorpha stercoravium]|uniref:Phospho-N-acetylmuramoyl-pentapeptide-transferase n=1 Tax=Candidatus Merdimorpha stercoravium TaxID=2840863 RepID=A0A9D1H9N2_9FLAO|nr:phospho-N-acetylmuramoyl-pentapeptide-transferase [Candidatus Merdimorpha stercoravium]
MIYYLFNYLDRVCDFPGAGMFNYISFRGSAAFLLSLIIALVFGKKIIRFLRRKQIGETVRHLGLAGQEEKAGTPTMGGVIIILATVVPVLLFARLDNIYLVLLLITTLWMGAIGFLDDYIKVFRKNKDGLKGRFKIVGQVGLGLLVGCVLYFSPQVTIREASPERTAVVQAVGGAESAPGEGQERFLQAEEHSTKTTIPFVKNNEFDYAYLISWLGDNYRDWVWLLFIPVVIFIITAVSNGANLTDGIDGLAAGTSAVQASVLGLFAWLSGNIIFADYLNIMYIPDVGELMVFICAFVGALIGFLWYNAYPAQVFMGDTGSLTIGGIIAVLAICVRKELLLPLISGIFLVEALSVMIQVSYFKYTKRKYGQGRRIFLMAPLHHHYQKKGLHESKIVTRFWIISVFLAVLSIVTLKIR